MPPNPNSAAISPISKNVTTQPNMIDSRIGGLLAG
jgi:hypothetical protein